MTENVKDAWFDCTLVGSIKITSGGCVTKTFSVDDTSALCKEIAKVTTAYSREGDTQRRAEAFEISAGTNLSSNRQK